MYENITKTEAKQILSSDITEIMDIIKDIKKFKTTKEITYSRNVFLPLTHACKNNCGYCTFRKDINNMDNYVLTKENVLKTVNQAKNTNCTEVLFAFGEAADEYDEVKSQLEHWGYDSMVDYVYNLSDTILNEYELLPHTNMGLISNKDLKLLSTVNASMGLMLETTNKKLLKTIVHKDSPGKNPTKRLNFIKNAGKQNIPFTTGLLIGIGEKLSDRVDSLFEIRKLHNQYSHIQEIIIQNFKAKQDIPMKDYPEPSTKELLKTTILAKLMFPDVSIQIPPNLNKNIKPFFIFCGADDVGGISPVTKDYINPSNTWPQIKELGLELNRIGYKLKERLPVYDKFINKKFLKEEVYKKALKLHSTIN